MPEIERISGCDIIPKKWIFPTVEDQGIPAFKTFAYIVRAIYIVLGLCIFEDFIQHLIISLVETFV